METIVSAVVAMVAAGVLLIGATVADKKPELCQAMGGTYQAAAADQCPDGKWANLLRSPR
jgi:hypothetical protein